MLYIKLDPRLSLTYPFRVQYAILLWPVYTTSICIVSLVVSIVSLVDSIVH